jgi:site-specific recombinase XerD
MEALLPLFEQAKIILDTWMPDWEKQSPDTLLAPKISNQKFNNYLGEIISLLGIEKKISTHCGRHTFATTVALENGVGIETVSKMLGHSKIAQTQKYAKVTALKIERETKDLCQKLAG